MEQNVVKIVWILADTSSPPLEPPIFNYVSSVENRITWGDFVFTTCPDFITPRSLTLSVLSYFCTREIIFRNEKTQELWEKTSEVDKKLYPFSMAEINWDEYFDEYLAGIRRYLFKRAMTRFRRPELNGKIILSTPDSTIYFPWHGDLRVMVDIIISLVIRYDPIYKNFMQEIRPIKPGFNQVK
ncbi:unnamed protein product [Arctia plantaginis]|uniref:Fatty acyl-CoA reductase C-terminal domain-containing protein n=1 Tax=Arctia plantaginis TaxID=874455 RepID=A0A8S1BSP3_ARCPL|nr:unnamed protein product [Arctia plantaginis]